jgi:hypothetical protein
MVIFCRYYGRPYGEAALTYGIYYSIQGVPTLNSLVIIQKFTKPQYFSSIVYSVSAEVLLSHYYQSQKWNTNIYHFGYSSKKY